MYPPRSPFPGSFSEGLAPVRLPYNDDRRQVGYVDTAGNVVIAKGLLAGESFSEGLAAVIVGDEDRRRGYIDRTGKVVVAPRFADA